MPRINVFGLGQASKSPFVTAKVLQNLYVEARPKGEKSAMVAYGTPGYTTFVDFGDTPVRGGLEFEGNSLCYVVHRGTLWSINNAGVTTNCGSLLTTSGRVSMADNGVQIMIVDGTYGYIYNTGTGVFAQITDGDFPANPLTVTTLGRRFVVNFNDSGRFYVSDVDNGLSWDALNFANAESNPDDLSAVLASNGQLILFGPLTMEFWGNSGALDFPFAQVQGTAAEWGLAARWSIAKFDNSFVCLVKNRMGEVMIAKIGGYLPQKISTPDLDSIINRYSNTADASGYSYMLGGHAMYVINFPSANASWLYDGATQKWSSLKSYGLDRHRAEFSFPFLTNKIIADYETGKLYKLQASALTDNGDSIERVIVSETVAHPDLERFTVDCFRLDVEVGVGTATGQGSNPQIGLEVSKDNGKTWGTQHWKSLGAIGEYKTRVEWRRLGDARNFVFRITITDPVQVTLISACVNPED